jgi:DNA-3-methyladenine glycosylase II
MIVKLNETNLLEAATWLAGQDAALTLVLEKYGPPPLWARIPGFSTLVHMILEQQVSLASANAAFLKLQAKVEPLNPANLLLLDDGILREIGFSRQKTSYARALAQTIAMGDLDLEKLEGLPDDEVRIELKRLKGIGDWTADIYLSECLLRTDILPQGDIAMQEAFRVLNGLENRPIHRDFVQATEHWRPWRSVGTRMLWHFYLCERGRGSTIS